MYYLAPLSLSLSPGLSPPPPPPPFLFSLLLVFCVCAYVHPENKGATGKEGRAGGLRKPLVLDVCSLLLGRLIS